MKEISNVFPIMKKNTSALAKTSWLANTSTKKTKEEIEIKHEIRFIDSFKFMASPLESLVGNLVISGSDKLRETQNVFGVILMITWAVSQSLMRLCYRQNLFFSKLNDSGISDEDYLQATKVWNEFKVRNMEDRLPRSLSQISCFVAHRRL